MDDGRIEQAASLEIGHQCRGRLIHFLARSRQTGTNSVVMIPGLVLRVNIDEPDRFVREFEPFSDTLSEQGVTLVVGGRALDADLRRRMRFAAHCDTLQQLEMLGDTLTGRGDFFENELSHRL